MTDTGTGLVWLKNANCTDTVGGVAKPDGYLNWNDAATWSNGLSSGACGLSDGSHAGDWRVPTIDELKFLICGREHRPGSTTVVTGATPIIRMAPILTNGSRPKDFRLSRTGNTGLPVPIRVIRTTPGT